ncbi:MAG: type I-C CRISPR-associated protein Cas5c [Oscillospiraceae bacterium]
MGIRLLVWGDYALFSRPEMKTERVSYDVMTASAARGIIEAIMYKPAIKWIIDKIYVYNPIRFTSIKRNEVSSKISARNVNQVMNGANKELFLNPTSSSERQLRSSIVLKNVKYVIEAHFEMTDKAGERDSQEKFFAMSSRRMRNGECFHNPYFGCREFPVSFKLIEDDFVLPNEKELAGEIDLGYMLYDMDYSNASKGEINPMFVRVKMIDGVIDFENARPIQ